MSALDTYFERTNALVQAVYRDEKQNILQAFARWLSNDLNPTLENVGFINQSHLSVTTTK